MKLKITLFLLITASAFLSCYDGADISAEIVIDYDGSWNALITENYITENLSGAGRTVFSFNSPDALKAVVTKLDTSLNKLAVYIYEDGRISAAGSTREPGGSVTAEYEFPY